MPRKSRTVQPATESTSFRPDRHAADDSAAGDVSLKQGAATITASAGMTHVGRALKRGFPRFTGRDFLGITPA